VHGGEDSVRSPGRIFEIRPGLSSPGKAAKEEAPPKLQAEERPDKYVVSSKGTAHELRFEDVAWCGVDVPLTWRRQKGAKRIGRCAACTKRKRNYYGKA
jgi:hypothetical protein